MTPDEKAASRGARHPRAAGARLRPPRRAWSASTRSIRRSPIATSSRSSRRPAIGSIWSWCPRSARRATSQFVDTLLTQIEASTRADPTDRHRGADRDGAAASCTRARSPSASPRLEALIFGAGDYAASMRMPSAAIGEADAHDDDLSRPPLARRDAHHRRGGAGQRPALHGRPVRRLQGRRRPRARLPDRAGDGLRRQAVHPSRAARHRERRLCAVTTKRSTRAAAVRERLRGRRRRRPGRRHARRPDDRRRQRPHGAHDPRAPPLIES